MYVCVCNSINDREVESAIKSGAQAWEEVHDLYGCEPKCGQCRAEIVEAIVEHKTRPGIRSPGLAQTNLLNAAE